MTSSNQICPSNAQYFTDLHPSMVGGDTNPNLLYLNIFQNPENPDQSNNYYSSVQYEQKWADEGRPLWPKYFTNYNHKKPKDQDVFWYKVSIEDNWNTKDCRGSNIDTNGGVGGFGNAYCSNVSCDIARPITEIATQSKKKRKYFFSSWF